MNAPRLPDPPAAGPVLLPVDAIAQLAVRQRITFAKRELTLQRSGDTLTS